MPHYILLTGAGFSRNWGGWLANETFEYLLGDPQIEDGIRNVLWRYKRQGGFEATLAQLQSDFAHNRNDTTEKNLVKLESAILQMFADMDKAFAGIRNFEFQSDGALMLRSYLVRFDAIFTLNQDLLLERHYLNGNIALSQYRSWNGWQIPGMVPLPRRGDSETIPRRSPDESKFTVENNLQPYFKLHGSSNWIDGSSGRPILVMGGNKPNTIRELRVLDWYHEEFSGISIQAEHTTDGHWLRLWR